MLGLFRRYGFAAAVMAALALMALVVVGKSLLGALAGGGAQGPQGAPGGGPGGGALVAVAQVAPHTFTDIIEAIGTAQARESVILTPKVADTIRTLHFDSGDRVRRGQVLVEMSSVEQSASLSEAVAANEAAQQELRRYQELYDRGFASQARLDAVRAAADAAEARVNAGGSRIADRTIRAPFAGVVGLRTASPGQFVRPGDQIGTLDDIAEIKLDFDVPETNIARLAPGVSIEARTAAYPERSFTGAIAQVDSRIDPTTRTVRVRALLPNRDEALRPGMLMTVRVHANARQALAIPEIAILDQAEGAFVFRVASRDGAAVAERVRIETGLRSGGMAEVLSGLAEGERVVTEGVQAVRPGQPVRVSDGADAAPGAVAGGLRPRAANAP